MKAAMRKEIFDRLDMPKYLILGGNLPSEHQNLLAVVVSYRIKDEIVERVDKGDMFPGDVDYRDVLTTVKTEHGETMEVSQEEIDHEVRSIPKK